MNERAAELRRQTERIIVSCQFVIDTHVELINQHVKRGWFGSYKIVDNFDVAHRLQNILESEIVIERAKDILVFLEAGRIQEAIESMLRLVVTHGIQRDG